MSVMMPSTAVFDYGRPTSIAQMLGSHYIRTIGKVVFFTKISGGRLIFSCIGRQREFSTSCC